MLTKLFENIKRTFDKTNSKAKSASTPLRENTTSIFKKRNQIFNQALLVKGKSIFAKYPNVDSIEIDYKINLRPGVSDSNNAEGNNNPEDLDANLGGLITNLLTSTRENELEQDYSRYRVNESSVYDFNVYQMITEPGLDGYSGLDISFMDEFLKLLELTIRDLVFSDPLVRQVSSAKQEEECWLEHERIDEYAIETFEVCQPGQRLPDESVVDEQKSLLLIDELFQLFQETMAIDLYEEYVTVSEDNRQNIISQSFASWFISVYNGKSMSYSSDNSILSTQTWLNGYAVIKDNIQLLNPTRVSSNAPSYNFRPYNENEIAYGIEINYKQVWRPKGLQKGEIVKTIPLGPKQTEKISVKTVSKRKSMSSFEESTSYESNDETSNTNKTTDEIVKEASEKFTFGADAKYGMSELSEIKANTSYESANSTKDTKSNINENVKKVAQKFKSESKTIVKNEFENESEYQRTTEINNPNDDIAITYAYTKLTQNFELSTVLNKITDVIFVPEPLPKIDDINESWIKRYDWILSKALLDKSFEKDLVLVSQSSVQEIENYENDSNNAKDPISTAATNASKGILNYRQHSGETLTDVYSEPLKLFTETRERQNNTKRINQEYKNAIKRLQQHIKDNILHYMQAIWMNENQQQRYFRYKDRLVPTKWRKKHVKILNPTVPFAPNALLNDLIHDLPQDLVDAYVDDFTSNLPGDSYFATDLRVEMERLREAIPPLEQSEIGEYVPDMSPSSLTPLADIIENMEPIAIQGNALVFKLKKSKQLPKHNEQLRKLKHHYLKYFLETEDQAQLGDFVFVSNGGALINEKLTLRLSIDYSYHVHINGNFLISGKYENGKIEIDENTILHILNRNARNSNIDFKIRSSSILEDPEYKSIVKDNSIPSRLVDEERDDIKKYLSVNEESKYESLQDNGSKTTFLQSQYHRYLFEKANTSEINIDTKNLMLEIIVDKNVVLEDFKRSHRIIDVLKEKENYKEKQLSNLRRTSLIEAHRLIDPDIDNMTVNINQP